MVGIESGGGFIEDEQLGIAEERLGETYALAVTLAQFADMFMALGGQTYALDEGVYSFAFIGCAVDSFAV